MSNILLLRLMFIFVVPVWLCQKETRWTQNDLLAARIAPWEDIRRAKRLTGTVTFKGYNSPG